MKTESIFSNKNVIIPMAEVSHLEHDNHGLWVIFKHSSKNKKSDLKVKYEPAIWLDGKEKSDFLDSWLFYRHEVDNVNTKEV